MGTRLELLSEISRPNDRKILFVIVDGLGGLAHPKYGKTELEYATLPNLDAFVRRSQTVTGLIYPVGRGIIPGSGAGHLGLFGYDPLDEHFSVGRGALEAAALNGLAKPLDIAGRVNFCTLDTDGTIVDRRAGRIKDCTSLAEEINRHVRVGDASTQLVATKEHRGVLLIKNDGRFSARVSDTDPQEDGLPIQRSEPLPRAHGVAAAEATAKLINEYTRQANMCLADSHPANGIIIRSLSTFPKLPNFNDVYSLHAAAIAVYPLYQGIARLLGMRVLNGATCLAEEVALLKRHYKEFDFFYLHYKKPDSKGEDGDFVGKVRSLEAFDSVLPDLLSLDFDVVAITGDHSTPAAVSGHSHHSVPIAIWSNYMKGYDETDSFDERAVIHGSLGRMDGVELMTVLLANAQKLLKFEGYG